MMNLKAVGLGLGRIFMKIKQGIQNGSFPEELFTGSCILADVIRQSVPHPFSSEWSN